MIRATLKAHGKRHIEVKQRVSFPEAEKNVRYRVETWFFMPATLQINRWTYTPQEFQRSLKNYIRLRPPTADLRTVAEKGGALEQLEREMEAVLASGKEEMLARYENALKLFCLTYKRALKLAVERVSSLAERGVCDEQIMQFSVSIERCLQNYRRLAPKAQHIEALLKSSAFSFSDEYLAIVTTHYGRGLLHALPAGEGLERLRQLWKNEMLYRAQHYAESVPSKDSDNELPVYRWGVLKKYISSYLFLEVRRKHGASMVLHSAYGLAAALSMVFATVIAFAWQDRYGALSYNLFLALVIGYIFKDRMKDIFREKLFSLLRRWIPDRRQVIYADHQTVIGRCEESFRFIDEKDLPADILQLRDKSHLVDVANAHRSEDIIFYSKDVTLKNTPALFERTKRAVLDISRFDISDFLKHTDEMQEEMPTIDDEDLVVGEKVYHINMIRKIVCGDAVSLERKRIVVNFEGIKRIEDVALAGESKVLL